MTIPLQTNIVYGPVPSRRLGYSLGINLLPSQYKLCSFNCIYCQYGWTRHLTTDGTPFLPDLPSVEQVLSETAAALEEDFPVDTITFSGNGEPTLHPAFPEIAAGIKQLRDRLRPGAKIALLSNAGTLHHPGIREALNHIDAPFFKLDAGNEDMFKRINRPAPQITLQRVVENLMEIRDFGVQALFLKGKITNSGAAHLKDWFSVLQQINPREVQLYSLARPTPYQGIYPLDEEELAEIARWGREITGLLFKVFTGGGSSGRSTARTSVGDK